MRISLPRVVTVLAVAAILAALTVVGASTGEAHAATQKYSRLWLNQPSTLTIVDDESWPSSDAVGSFELGFFGMAQLTPTFLNDRAVFSRCVGNEVRVELTVTERRTPFDLAVHVGISAKLYEGASCATTDLDGSVSMAEFTLNPGDFTTKAFTIKNTAEGGDFAIVSLDLAVGQGEVEV